MIGNIKTVAIYVADQEVAERFYTEQLGFEVRRRQAMGADASWLEMAPPGGESRVVLYPRSLMKDWAERKPSIVFGCEDVAAEHRTLSERGVVFTQEPAPMPWGTFAAFRDPDGNEFLLAEGR